MIFDWLKGKVLPRRETNKQAEGGASPSGLSDSGASRSDGTLPDGLLENAVALTAGIEMVDAYYPGRDPIDYYGNGGFRFGDMSHQGALMFLPSGTRRWDVTTIAALTNDDFAHLIREKEDVEILLLGTGKLRHQPDKELLEAIRAEGIKVDIMDTGAAVRTLNILLSEDRAVAAALLPVD